MKKEPETLTNACYENYTLIFFCHYLLLYSIYNCDLYTTQVIKEYNNQQIRWFTTGKRTTSVLLWHFVKSPVLL